MSVVALDSKRPLRLGGSTLPAAAGIDPYCSPVRLWLELTGRVAREETEPMRLGRALEPVIVAQAEAAGYVPLDIPPMEYEDESRPWLVGHPDRIVAFPESEDGVVVSAAPLEAKATHAYEPQNHHLAQLQTYMHLTGAEKGVLAILAWPHFRIVEVERNQYAIDRLLALGERFMGYLRRDEPPPVQGHDDDRKSLLLAYPTAAAGQVIRESRDVLQARVELKKLLEREKVQKARMEHLRAVISEHMGEADTLLSAKDEIVATWRNVTTRRVDTKRLKVEQPDVWEAFAVENTTRTLRLP